MPNDSYVSKTSKNRIYLQKLTNERMYHVLKTENCMEIVNFMPGGNRVAGCQLNSPCHLYGSIHYQIHN